MNQDECIGGFIGAIGVAGWTKLLIFADNIDLIVGSKEKRTYYGSIAWPTHRYGMEISGEMSKGSVATKNVKTLPER